MGNNGNSFISFPVSGGDGMADNYILFQVFAGEASSTRSDRIGYNRNDVVKELVHEGQFDNTVAVSLHIAGDVTDYKNLSGNTAYVIVTVNAATNVGDRAFKIYSAPTTNSVIGADEVFDSTSLTGILGWNAVAESATSYLVPIQNNHFIVLENTSGSASRNLNILAGVNPKLAIVIEQG